jgi:hypothetical protein
LGSRKPIEGRGVEQLKKNGLSGFIAVSALGAMTSICARPGAAQTPRVAYAYGNVAIVAGGFISGIVPHPAARGLMYVRTDIGGAYRWDGSEKRWVPLTDWVSMGESNLLGIESIGLDATDPNKLYLAVGTYDKPWAPNGAILRSEDQGRSFKMTRMPFKMGGNEDGRFAGERLAVDPNLPSVLYFGSRNDGLWKSVDGAVTWSQVTSFPGKSTNRIGVVFEIFEAGSGKAKSATPVIYAGVSSDEGSLFASRDAGQTWAAVAGAPKGLLPNHGQMDADGWLYLTYANAPGPNGISNGAVWKYNTKTLKWKDITPEIPGAAGAPAFGYGGLAVDAGHAGTLMVSTIDHWNGGDDIYRSTDGGAHWMSLKAHSERDDSLSPYLTGTDGKVPLGHWIGTIAIDPFDGNHALYGTGATLWSTNDLEQLNAKKTSHWVVGAAGIEETAVLSLMSPPKGANLFSGFGDIGCFRDDDFKASPRGGALRDPSFAGCESQDYAAADPGLMVRSGSQWGGSAHGGFSIDTGVTWKPFATEPGSGNEGGKIAISADGKVVLWSRGKGVVGLSTNRGESWKSTDQAPQHAQIVADRVNAERFYLYDSEGAKLYVENGSDMNFSSLPLAMPKQGKLYATPGHADDLWIGGGAGLVHADAVANPPVAQIKGVDEVYALGFGRPKDDGSYPTLFVSAKINGQQGIFRSTDKGASWEAIDDADHHYGWIGVIAGDPRVFGRVYLGTNGRGVILGEPAK